MFEVFTVIIYIQYLTFLMYSPFFTQKASNYKCDKGRSKWVPISTGNNFMR